MRHLSNERQEAQAPPPAPAWDGIDLDARTVTARMHIPDNGRTFHHAYGCVVREQVEQCISIWAISPEVGAAEFAEALVATAEHLTATQLVPGTLTET